MPSKEGTAVGTMLDDATQSSMKKIPPLLEKPQILVGKM